MRTIDDITFHQTFVERLLGIGQIAILSSDPSNARLRLVGVPDEPGAAAADDGEVDSDNGHRSEAGIRPERFARLVTLASILIEAGRAGRRLHSEELQDSLKASAPRHANTRKEGASRGSRPRRKAEVA